MTADLSTRLSKARLDLLLDFPFFGQLAMRLEPVVDPAVETAETDGVSIRFNPAFCDPLNDRQLLWLYAHEVSHPAFGHLWRIGPRNVEKFNRAADYAVNEMLAAVVHANPSRIERIPGTLLEPRYFGMSAEEIYTLLPDQPSGPVRGNAVGSFTKPAPPEPGTADGGEGEGSGPGDTLEQEWKAAALQAATAARMKAAGDLPSAIEDLLRDLVEPAVPWQDLLRQFASRICRDDYTWRRPNRRYLHRGFMLPTLRTEGLGSLVVAVDTSGSIRCCERLLTTFLSELQGILDECRPEVVTLLDCDARVHSATEFHPGDDLRGTRFRGGGGTCFRPVFDHVARADLRPDALVYFTDLEGGFPEDAPDYPVLWLNYGSPRSKAPFGETVTVLPA